MRLLILLIFMFSLSAQAEVSFAEFQTVRAFVLKEYASDMQAQNAKLFINEPPPNSPTDFWWNIPTVRAAYGSYMEGGVRRMHYLTLMGGYGKLPWMGIDTIAATLCHELGHGIAGEPFKDSDENVQSSTEGQADYFSYRHCLPRILKYYEQPQTVKPVSAYTDSLCRKAYADTQGYQYCTRAFHSLEVEKKYFKMDTGADVAYETPDLSVVSKTDLQADFYPSPQCRLDTMMAGVLGKDRPACWYKP